MREPIISVSGIRGIFGQSLNPHHILKFTSAFAELCGRGRVVIGRDGRLCGELIENLVQSTLLFSGCEIINLGIVPTPTISLAVRLLKASGGISITASHNPQQWNGLKFINSRAMFLDKIENKKLIKKAGKDHNYVPVNKIKPVKYYNDFVKYHVERITKLKSVNVDVIKKRKFKVLVDCVNASGSVVVPLLLRRLGCVVYEINCDGSGIFGRKPEPLPENLISVMRKVREKKADMGIVVDPDADRLVIITEKGEPFGEENTITTAVRRMMYVKGSNKIAVVNLSTSRSVDDIVKEAKGTLFKSPVGELNVIKKMIETEAVIGGEGSGGVILPELNYSRDSLAGIGLLLSEFAEFKGTVSEYKKTLPEYFIKKSVIKLEVSDPGSIFKILRKKYKSYKVNSEDGLRIDFPEGWVIFRKSNTEPVLRVITEAKTERLAEKMKKTFVNDVRSLS